MADMRNICKVEEFHYVSSDNNPANLGTRDGTKLTDIGPGSFCQKGPLFLSLRRIDWLVNRDFRERSSITSAHWRGVGV